MHGFCGWPYTCCTFLGRLGMQDICRSGLLSGCCLEEVLGELTFWMSSYLCTCILLCWINLISYLIVYKNFIICLRGFLSSWLLWSSTIQLRKWSKMPSNTPGFSLLPTTTGMYWSNKWTPDKQKVQTCTYRKMSIFRATSTGWLRMRKLGIPCVSIGHLPDS
jgi:hypothetical protein